MVRDIDGEVLEFSEDALKKDPELLQLVNSLREANGQERMELDNAI
jgi:hypothetical protein